MRANPLHMALMKLQKGVSRRIEIHMQVTLQADVSYGKLLYGCRIRMTSIKVV